VSKIKCNEVTVYFGVHAASGMKRIARIELEPYYVQDSTLMERLVKNYPHAFVDAGDKKSWKLKHGLVVRYIRSATCIANALSKVYQGRLVDELLLEKGLQLERELVESIVAEYREQVTCLSNLFIGCRVENEIYEALIPAVNAALRDARPNEKGVLVPAVSISIPPELLEFVRRHSKLKYFLANATGGAFECRELGRLKALVGILNYDDPVIATKVPPVWFSTNVLQLSEYSPL
jgi:hypothetical protein